MRLTLDLLRSVDVFNDCDFFGDEVFIYCRPAVPRQAAPSCWGVRKEGVDLSQAWYDYGSRTFSYHNCKTKQEALIEAKQWAEAEFAITEWMRAPTGAYGNRSYVEKRNAELREKVRT